MTASIVCGLLVALAVVGGSVALAARCAYRRGLEDGLVEGYGHGEQDGRKAGYLDGALDAVLLTPTLGGHHADEALALVATGHLGQIAGSTAFGSALLNAELRQGLHEGGVFPWQRQAADGQVAS